MVVGLIVVPAGGGGTFLGGYVTRHFRLTRSGVIKMYMWCQLITVPMALGFLFYCADAPFAGVNRAYGDAKNASSFALDASCNAGCECRAFDYEPSCGADGVQYFSPCHAGCASSAGGGPNFTECACVDEGLSRERTATLGKLDLFLIFGKHINQHYLIWLSLRFKSKFIRHPKQHQHIQYSTSIPAI